MPQQVVLNLDQLDDIPIGDGTPSFSGGMVSNDQANLIGETESAYLLNCDRSRIGKITTRKGSIRLGGGNPGAGPIIQGMAFYQPPGADGYLVVASGGKLYKESGASWVQIATGGVQDNDDIEIIKTAGQINHTGGYNVGDTTIIVDGFSGDVEPGDKFIFWQRDKTFEYTVLTAAFATGNTTITVAQPGLVVKVYDNDQVIIKRFGAEVNHGAGYPGGTIAIDIDGLTGVLDNGDKFIIKGEDVIHTVTTHTESGGNTTHVGFTPQIQIQYSAPNSTVPIIFALGGGRLFWTDGVGAIYSWDDSHTGNLANGNIYDYGSIPAPFAVKSIAWFQNRLIAAGPASDPDAIFFSDFSQGSVFYNRWDNNFQQLRVGAGESDPIVTIIPWMDLNLVVFKEHAIYVINMDPSQNPDPTDPTLLVASYAVKLITHFEGIASPLAVTQIGGEGGDIFFFGSDRKVRSLRRVIAAEQQQEIGQSVSFPVENYLARVNFNTIQNAVAYYWNNRYMLAVPIDGATYPNALFVFDTALHNWDGIWAGWVPTAFTVKLLGEGQQALVIGQSNNRVLQWLEDTGADETLTSTYQDDGASIVTAIQSRAFSFGDLYNWKTGLNVEFEFSDSLATITASAVRDLGTIPGTIGTFPTTTFNPLVLPFTIPATLPTATFKRIQKDLMRFGQFREIQIYIYSPSGKFSCRSLKATAFMDSIQLQTLEDTPLFDTPPPPVPQPL